MTLNLIYRILVVTLLYICLSCEERDEPLPQGEYTQGVLISNEGNFSDADGSVGYLSSDKGMQNRVFEAENGRPFGGLLQFIGLHMEHAYLIDNLGDRIEVVDANSFRSLGTLTEGLSLPRYFEAGTAIAYISNWGPYAMDFTSPDSFIAVMDLEQNAIIQQIEVPSRPEGLLIANDKLFVSSLSSDTVTVIDTNTNQKIGSIRASFGPSHFVKDKNGMVWVACSNGDIFSFDPAANQVLNTVDIGNLSGKISIDGQGENLYLLTNTYSNDFTFTENEVLKVSVSSTDVVTSIFSARNLYGIGIDPLTGIVYLSNSNAFLGNGTVIRISGDGEEIDNFEAGRGPNGFVFRN